MKKISTVTTKKVDKNAGQKLTIGLDLGDRSSWYCVLDEAGEVVLEQKLATTPKAMKEVFGGCRGVGSRWKRGRTRHG
jgi:transposase